MSKSMKSTAYTCPAVMLPTQRGTLKTKLKRRIKGDKELKFQPSSFENSCKMLCSSQSDKAKIHSMACFRF